MIYGMDYILGAKYEQAIIDGHPKGRAAGFLIKVSGIPSSFKTIAKLASSGKTNHIRVHGVWRDNHDFDKTQKKQAIKRAKRLAPIIEATPNINWYYSPFLEPRNPRKRLYNSTLRKCREVLPCGVKLVASSLEGIVYKQADITEMHHKDYHNAPGATIFSYDGLTATSKNIALYRNLASQAEIFFLWHHKYNGKKSDSDSTPRADREAWATKQDIKALDALI